MRASVSLFLSISAINTICGPWNVNNKRTCVVCLYTVFICCCLLAISSCPVEKDSSSPSSPKKEISYKQRVSAIHTPLPPVPKCSPQLLRKLADSLPPTPPDVQKQLINEYDHTSAPPVPYRPHAATKISSDYNSKEIMRQSEEKSKKQRPLSIKLRRFVTKFSSVLP